MRLWVVLNLLLLTFSGLAPAWKVEGTASFSRWKEKFHVSHSAFIDNHGVLGGELLTAGQRWQFISPCGSIDNSGVGVGGLTNSLLPIIVKAWLPPLGFLWHHPWERKGVASSCQGEGANPGSHVVSLDVVDGDSSLSSRMKVSALMVFPDTTPRRGFQVLITASQEWKSRLHTQPLLLGLRGRAAVFPVLLSRGEWVLSRSSFSCLSFLSCSWD